MIAYSANHLGRKAFQTHGVKGLRLNCFPANSKERQEFHIGFDDARMDAVERSLKEAAAYHSLSVRDNAKDREWAAKFAARAASI